MSDYEELACPFCKEEGFDTMGLKSHLEKGYCEKYNSVPEFE